MRLVEIRIDDLTSPDVLELRRGQLAEMRSVTPREESVHALDLDGLRRSQVTVRRLSDDERLRIRGRARVRPGEAMGEVRV